MEKRVDRREFLKASVATGAILSMAPHIVLAQEPKAIQLTKPQMGSPLMQLLGKRMSSRKFSLGPLPIDVLSNPLWAAFGINRPDGKRTAPTASNRQEIDIYVSAANGLYLHDAKASLLKPILAEDIRGMTGLQPFVKEAGAVQKWEAGKFRPKDKKKSGLVALRKLPRREVRKLLEEGRSA